MKKFLTAILLLIGFFSYGQSVGYLRYDTVKVLKAGGSATLKVEGAMQATTYTTTFTTSSNAPAIGQSFNLGTIVADRTITFLDLETGRNGTFIYVYNSNSSAFVWNVAGNVYEGDGTVISTLPRGLHIFYWNSNAWIRLSTSGGSSPTVDTLTFTSPLTQLNKNVYLDYSQFPADTISFPIHGDSLYYATYYAARNGNAAYHDSLAILRITSSGVTSIATGYGINGGTVTTTGTLTADTSNHLASKLRLYKVADSLGALIGSGFTDPMTTNGDMITRAGGVASRLGIGATGQYLSVVGAAPTWTTPTSVFPIRVGDSIKLKAGSDTSVGVYAPVSGSPAWGGITGTLSAQTDLQTALDTKFSQSGNSFGATAVLGTNDDNDLVIETNGTGRFRFDHTGIFYQGTSAPPSALTLGGYFTDTLVAAKGINFVGGTPTTMTGFTGTGTTMLQAISNSTIFTYTNPTTGNVKQYQRSNSATSGTMIVDYNNIRPRPLTTSTATLVGNHVLFNYAAGADTVYSGNLNGSYIGFQATQTFLVRHIPAVEKMIGFTNDFSNNYFNTPVALTTGVPASGFGHARATALTSRVDITATNGYNQLRLRTSYTPSATGDTNGSTGDFSWDDSYFYIKTSAGWKRSALTSF